MSDAAALRAEIQRARAAETKAKAQVYTLRGKKGLQAMAAAMGEDLPPQLASSTSTVYEDPEDSPQIQELRRQIALLKEMEEQQRQQIEELKAKKEARLARSASQQQQKPMELPRVDTNSQPSNIGGINIAKSPMPSSQSNITVPQPVAQAPVASQPSYINSQQSSGISLQKQDTPSPTPSPVSTPTTPSPVVERSMPPASATTPVATPKTPVRKGKGGKLSMGAPAAMVVKVLNASWDSGSVKSKKNNKVYTIQVTMDSVTWKIIRGDDALVELSKRVSKCKAEGSPLPPLVKKVVKRDQQNELGASVETYLNQIQTQIVFDKKNSKTKAAYLKFFAPFSPRDEGMGNYPKGTSDVEGWFIWKLGLA